jgi:catechol 2,3-dioxygenase-like lactoylglutathione lyase family enzyme
MSCGIQRSRYPLPSQSEQRSESRVHGQGHRTSSSTLGPPIKRVSGYPLVQIRVKGVQLHPESLRLAPPTRSAMMLARLFFTARPGGTTMAVQVYGCNHVVIEVDDAEKAVQFYSDVFNLKMLRGGEGAAWCKLGEHQFMAIFEVKQLRPDRVKHFGLMVRDKAQIQEVRKKLTKEYGLKLEDGFQCDFRDPWGNRIQVVDLHDESLVWLLPYAEVQKAGITFNK